MSTVVDVAGISELREGAIRKVTAGGTSILLARIKGRYYAAEATCPHLHADLSEGTLQGTVLTCPFHGSRFDLRDGHVVRWTDLSGIKLTYAMKARPPRPLATYPVHIEGDRILITLP